VRWIGCARGSILVTMSALLAFLGVAALVIVTPGQDTILTIRNTLAGGRTAGVFTAAGVAVGQLSWTLAATAGLAATLAALPRAFVAIQLVGAAYLLYLGAKSVIGEQRKAHQEPSVEGTVADRRPSLRYLRQGLLSNLGNPKMLVFFTSLLPQFLRAGDVRTMLGLGALFSAMTLSWLSVYAVAVTRLDRFISRRRVQRGLEVVMGLALAAIGLRVAVGAVS
jgi:threonine/homoserine/homoserine lactone efflux protein